MKKFNSTKIENNNINVSKVPKSNKGENISSQEDTSSNIKPTDSELKSLSKETLSLARNEIFARHGYIFQTEPYKSYFNSKTWYKLDASFKGTDEELNETEKYNVKLILKYENNK
ncbi:hypothetical protein CLOACE_16260 [Clostridium acetireducens DSM 10703]|uniref:YARHG domain-containing protein n=1 Tax=Clostridium acetireducens DSM 10703 TaxID=1121290 RepID=A0A1E8EXM1_9CLOT|nr:YARHG domain-containing protein [Clostridium acetireducens]OFI05543.1 hypothetical protein CLOACE_16260 [Clostridium acetireducens DSM 10703]